jgi:putative radical SAM enzyme (TIGR03279 family)
MKVIAVQTGSPAEGLGILVGDDLERINGHPARDVLDVWFWMADEGAILELRRDGEVFEVRIEEAEDRDLGLEFEEMTIRRCGNRCVFCFVDQLPSGMRPALYVKDEDIRLSFLHGSYVTLADVSGEDIERIVEQRLSPMYISVHATDPKVRGRLLGRRGGGDVLPTMRRLSEAGIWMHTQIVLCPGINDGSELERTVRDVSAFFPQVRSIAVVPVGLKRHRDGLAPLNPVGRAEARRCIEQVTEWQEKFLNRFGERLVYAADECYLAAGLEIPEAEDYEDFPQIENGVGMVRQFLDAFEAAEQRLPKRLKEQLSLTLVTGTSSEGFLRRMVERLEEVDGLSVRLVAVKNRFFGASITVSGLLTGQDILSALEQETVGDAALLPPNCINEDGFFLDDQTPEQIAQVLSVPVQVGSYDLVEGVLNLMSNEQ